MRPYETLVVLSNDLGGEIRPLVQRLETLIQTNGGTLDFSHDWGNRRLAYPIKKKLDGRYFLLEYTAAPAVVSELERTLRISDGVLRYLTVQQEHTGLPQARPKEHAGREDVPLNELRSIRRERGGAEEGGGQAAGPEPAASTDTTGGAEAGSAESATQTDEGVKPNE
jgi:small subunit ribosomal protein S6